MGIRIEPIGNEQSIARLQRYTRRQRFAARTLETMKTIETKYAHVFVNGEDQYLFVKLLAVGSEANAQLVVNARTSELLVRKVGHDLLNERDREKEDPEKILFLLQSQARLRGGVQPNLAHLQAAEDVPAPQESDGSLLYHRVKYFKFYNGGNLGDLYVACRTRSIGIPPSLIVTMIVEMVYALHFISSMDPYVIHGDAYMDNILLHWENNVLKFFLGDWGWSTSGRLRADNKSGLLVDIVKIWQHTRSLLGGGDSGLQPVLRQYLTEVIEPELCRLSYGPLSRLPDLAPLLRLLSAAPATTPPDMRPFMLTRESQSPPSPLLHDTWKDARKAKGIHGPWHVGQVSIDPSSGKLTIVRLSPATYHRPAAIPNSDSDSGSVSDDWTDVSSIKSEDWTLITGP